MSQRVIRCGFLFCLLAGARLAADLSPVVLADPIGRWQARAVGRPFGPGITLEMAVSNPDSKGRLLIFTSTTSIDSPESLHVFAGQLQSGFTSYQRTQAVERPANAMGFSGLEYDFDLLNNDETLACKLFVFASEGRPWGVIAAVPKDAALTSAPSFSLLRKRFSGGVVALELYQVIGVPFTSYPISFDITRDRRTNRIKEITVSEVPSGSPTEAAGVKTGDLVLRINQRSVESFAGGVDRESELGRIFIKRPPGEKVELDLLAANTRKPYSVTLHSASVASLLPTSQLEPP